MNKNKSRLRKKKKERRTWPRGFKENIKQKSRKEDGFIKVNFNIPTSRFVLVAPTTYRFFLKLLVLAYKAPSIC